MLRNKRVVLADEERQLVTEAGWRYSFISAAELDEGLRLMRADAAAHGDGWVDPRPTHFIAATKPYAGDVAATTPQGRSSLRAAGSS